MIALPFLIVWTLAVLFAADEFRITLREHAAPTWPTPVLAVPVWVVGCAAIVGVLL